MFKNVVFALMILTIALLAGCSGTQYKDGVYTAQAAEFASSGWKETMEITIEDGKLIKIDWDAIYKDDSIPIRKKTVFQERSLRNDGCRVNLGVV